MNQPLAWFRRLIWLGVFTNLSLAIPGLVLPDVVVGVLTEQPAGETWPRLSCLLIILLSLFYIPAAIDPRRYLANGVLAVMARLAAAAFFFLASREYLPLAVMDLAFGVVQGLLLYLGMKTGLKG